MTTWVLTLMLIGTGYSDSGSITTQEYYSKESCIKAGYFFEKRVDQFSEKYRRAVSPLYTCTPKGKD
jgi:hypothetical protein